MLRESPRPHLALLAILTVAACAGGARPPGTDLPADVQTARSELWLLADAQREYHDLNGMYARTVGSLRQVVTYEPLSGTAVDIVRATRTGFSAVSRRGRFECAYFRGSVPPPRGWARTRNNVECRDR